MKLKAKKGSYRMASKGVDRSCLKGDEKRVLNYIWHKLHFLDHFYEGNKRICLELGIPLSSLKRVLKTLGRLKLITKYELDNHRCYGLNKEHPIFHATKEQIQDINNALGALRRGFKLSLAGVQPEPCMDQLEPCMDQLEPDKGSG